MIKLVSLLIIAYLLGSIPSGIWIGKLFFHVDIRRHGSKNIGATNTFRVLGPLAGTIVTILDIGKGYLATWIPMQFGISSWYPLIFGVAAVLGHTFSIFDHFKGGKAVATSAGMLMAYNFGFFWIAAAAFTLCIFLTSMVSLGSMLGFVIIVIAAYFTHDTALTILAFVLTIFIFYRHRNNIKKIIHGQENIVPFGLYYWYLKYLKKTIK
ncbi:acyl-phosphate glycerol 3-phosphate acyltransferase [Fructilactobacillus lindneri]|uniref:Glycerol-3-phosphate acyltransferase n=2 Tax=Fructilactobacillus lindneri TaxID=53444 RepID=A0A0R2JPB6_9LACO|nr:glycerol-3-phosphate 1-O-acyltransferase PlsY [Fructilactobacillus lindneri]ANZ58171.1 acyl-phosphate glycerol 3-phosphate acyltransferase [Fructilactobacillus lindneri]ANZ59492.1 acyl-phosphate glycerol 3-phosphate acyltransferase [Fructilactobacillus lindneri]KRN78992.1 glycerol-3-phosphate acyltransferase [Fructilactobacillus lindneri DSM 20690 = JCM 11027]POG98724.1 acyl-phosphate glycerol 3-phosphate acyltransferase [Fructilactobacillus lindneri]POH02997.1 acyl-phosphate glycerol 3-pho